MYMDAMNNDNRKNMKINYKFNIPNMSEKDLLSVINEHSDFKTMYSYTRHFQYVKTYVEIFDRTNDNIKIISDIENYLNSSISPDSIKITYFNICNSINREKINLNIDIDIPRDVVMASNICIICNRFLNSKESECECGYLNPIVKSNSYYNTNGAIYSIIPRYMDKFLNNFTCNNPPKLNENYQNILDEYFISMCKLPGKEISSLYQTNMEKISNGYTLLVMYDALSKCKFNKPKDCLYFYAHIYWDWSYINISPDTIRLCSDLYNIFDSYRKSNSLNKVPPEYCSWWFLNNFGIKTDIMTDYKRNKSDNNGSKQNIYFSILEQFSIEYNVKIPDV